VPSLQGAAKKIRSLLEMHKLEKVFVATDAVEEGRQIIVSLGLVTFDHELQFWQWVQQLLLCFYEWLEVDAPPSLNGELNRTGQLFPSSLSSWYQTIHLVFPVGGLTVSTMRNWELNLPVPPSLSILPFSLAFQRLSDLLMGRVLWSLPPSLPLGCP